MKPKDEVLGVKIVGGLREEATPWAGVSLLVELFRRSGVDAVVDMVLPAKGSAKGLKQGQMVESFVVLSALAGECIDDIKHVRHDAGLRRILSYQLPAPETARQWLDKFHDESLIVGPLQWTFIPPESKLLSGLREVRRRTIWAYDEAVHPGLEATLDTDVQLTETTKESAQYCYEGYKAFGSAKVCWAETMLVLADEFRQGNVSPSKDIDRLVDEAYDMLPAGPWQVKVCSDSTGYQQECPDHWHNRGWKFAVSADMSKGLKKETEKSPEDARHLWRTEKDMVIKVTLPEEYVNVYPKRLRFSVFTVMGRIICHARRVLLCITDTILKTLMAPARRIVEAGWDTS